MNITVFSFNFILIILFILSMNTNKYNFSDEHFSHQNVMVSNNIHLTVLVRNESSITRKCETNFFENLFFTH